jgi:hypothetical protein
LKISKGQIATNGGGGLLRLYYSDSPAAFVSAVFPEFQWIPWHFPFVPRGFWEDLNNQRTYLDWVGQQVRYQTWEDWYQVNSDTVVNHFGGGLLGTHYNNSAAQLVMTVYAKDYPWLPWKFSNVPVMYWENKDHRRTFMNWVATELKILKWEDWYTVTVAQIEELGGAGLLTRHGRSVRNLIEDVFTEHTWWPWKFVNNISFEFWDSTFNLRWYFDWLMQVHSRTLTNPQLLARQTRRFYRENYAKTLFGVYKRPAEAVKRAFPGTCMNTFIFFQLMLLYRN